MGGGALGDAGHELQGERHAVEAAQLASRLSTSVLQAPMCFTATSEGSALLGIEDCDDAALEGAGSAASVTETILKAVGSAPNLKHVSEWKRDWRRRDQLAGRTRGVAASTNGERPNDRPVLTTAGTRGEDGGR